MPPPGSDSNVAFVLTQPQRIQVARALDGIVDGLPGSSSVLIDRAGRIVEIARKPFGVNLPAISALAAGCFATTHELAIAMGEDEYSLLFQHENDQQVYIWPVANRALLVVLLKGAPGSIVNTLEERLAASLGQGLVSVIREAQEPPKTVPPPRIAAPEIPPDLRHRTRALTALIMDLQAKRPEEFTLEVNKGLLASREMLVQALTKRDWRKAWEVCEGTRQWLLMQMHISQAQDVGQVLIRMYREVFTYMNATLRETASSDRLRIIYQSFFRFLSRQYPRVYTSDRFLSQDGVDVQALWEGGQATLHDSVQLSNEFVHAMDALVRELLRVIYLIKGNEGREAAVRGATGILETYKLELLPFGLESVAGRDWTLIPSQN
jgi:predicted regulator of Ras-like GTPase activity (Roadblock/LC7/MglB family)